MVLCGWPWHPRFSRFSRSASASPRRPGPYSNHPQGLPPPPPKVGYARWFINNPVQIAECGGPCTNGPSHCDCGVLWVDVPKLSFGEPVHLDTNPPPEAP